MFRRLLSGAVLAGAMLVSHPAGAQFNSDEWLNKAFIEPLPSRKADGKILTETKEQVLKELNKLASGTYLRATDVKNFAKGLQFLAGNYYYVDQDNVVQLIGKTSGKESFNQEIEIKDGIILRALVDDKIKAGLTLPFLGLNVSRDQIAELVVRDVATAHGDANIDRAACRYPLAFRRRDDIKLFYITAATLTTVTSKTFSKQEQGGNGLISVLNLNGNVYRSREFEQTEPVISISSISVNPVADADLFYCAEYTRIRKHADAAEAEMPTALTRSPLSNQAAERVRAANRVMVEEAEKQLARVIRSEPTAAHKKAEAKLKGQMLPVAGLKVD